MWFCETNKHRKTIWILCQVWKPQLSFLFHYGLFTRVTWKLELFFKWNCCLLSHGEKYWNISKLMSFQMKVCYILNIWQANLYKTERLMGNEGNVINIRRSDYSSQRCPIRLPFLAPTLQSAGCILHRDTTGVVYHPKLQTRRGLYTSETQEKTEWTLLPCLSCPLCQGHKCFNNRFSKAKQNKHFLVKPIQPKIVFPTCQFKCD